MTAFGSERQCHKTKALEDLLELEVQRNTKTQQCFGAALFSLYQLLAIVSIFKNTA
jgi:hypothetical protein